MKNKCCIYCRIAGEATEANKMAMESQLAALRTAAQDLGLEVVDERLAYEDGHDPNRQSIKSLVRDRCHGLFDYVLVSNLSRLSRSSEGIVEIGQKFDAHGLKVYTPEGVQMLATPRMVFYSRTMARDRELERVGLLKCAVAALEDKGYDREEANDLAQKSLENMDANPNGMGIDWFLDKVLDKKTYEETYGIQMY